MDLQTITLDIPRFASLFILLAGFVLGLGAVTVIDLHGFLGRKSAYWTEATVRAHKVTKPLIWIGITLTLIGGLAHYGSYPQLLAFLAAHVTVVMLLVLNGCFLSFVVSPFLLAQEKAGRANELLPAALQRKIVVSFLVSFVGWWALVALLAGSFSLQLHSTIEQPQAGSATELPVGYTLEHYVIEKATDIACERHDECETPMEFLVQSRCPFTSLCLENTCNVVCPQYEQLP